MTAIWNFRSVGGPLCGPDTAIQGVFPASMQPAAAILLEMAGPMPRLPPVTATLCIVPGRFPAAVTSSDETNLMTAGTL